MAVELPDDARRTRRIALAVAAGGLGTLLVAGGIWAATRPPAEKPAQPQIEPAQSTTAAPEPGATPATETASPDTSTPGAAPSEGPASGSGTATPSAGARPIAFRLGATVYVANEDGSSPRAVVKDDVSEFWLSPDGRWLALADPSGSLKLIAVDSGRAATLGKAAPAYGVTFAPDSSWFVYTRPQGSGYAIARSEVARPAAVLSAREGYGTAVSVDGKSVAFASGAQPDGAYPLAVMPPKGGVARRLAGTDGATGWAYAPGGTLYFTAEGDEKAWALVAVPAKGGQPTAVATVQLEAPAFTLTAPLVSPDGRYVVCTAAGDDDYARMVVFDTKTAWARTLTTRRDAYPYRWTSDGTRILYFEGNSYQGEASALMSVLPDGMGRRAVVTGAEH